MAQYVWNSGNLNNLLVLPGEVADCLSSAGAEQLRVLLWFSRRGDFDTAAMMHLCRPSALQVILYRCLTNLQAGRLFALRIFNRLHRDIEFLDSSLQSLD